MRLRVMSVVTNVSTRLVLERAVKEGALELKDETFTWEFSSAQMKTHHR